MKTQENDSSLSDREHDAFDNWAKMACREDNLRKAIYPWRNEGLHLTKEGSHQAMSITITGVVTNGVVVPNSPLPEGARVEILLQPSRPEVPPAVAGSLTPSELRKMPREQRQAVLAAAAEMAEQDYRDDKDLTGFDAFSEEELDDDEPGSR